jgi:hypothetical protein
MVARRGIIPAGVTRPKTQVTSGFADKRLRRQALGSGRPRHKTQAASPPGVSVDKRLEAAGLKTQDARHRRLRRQALRRQLLGSGRPHASGRKARDSQSRACGVKGGASKMRNPVCGANRVSSLHVIARPGTGRSTVRAASTSGTPAVPPRRAIALPTNHGARGPNGVRDGNLIPADGIADGRWLMANGRWLTADG